MTRPVRNKLFDLEIDEVSVVDRPANQHGLIAFAKSAGLGEVPNPQEDSMPEIEVYDSDGLEVDQEQLEHGDVVYAEDGTPYVFIDEGEGAEGDESYDEEDADQYDMVGKTAGTLLGRWAPAAGLGAQRVGQAGRAFGQNAKTAATGPRARKVGGAVWGNRSNLQRAGIVAAPTVATAGAAGAYGYSRTRKSLGDEVLEGLSKAVNDEERNEYIAKALNEVEIYKAANEQMRSELDDMHEQQIESVFISKAAEYNLPVSPEVLGPILKSMAEVLSDEQLDVVDNLFSAVGDALYDEIGYVGDTDNVSVLDQVDAYASELVGKSDLTAAQAQVAAFEANPAAYEAYLHEIGR